MALYCGIDLHSTNHLVTVIDKQDRRVYEKRLPNEIEATLRALEPMRETLSAIAVESTFNWYWLVDGLNDAGYEVKLVNTAAVKQYEGLKYADDRHDAFWLAHLLRLKILPTGYIYPKEGRAVRDLMRRRLGLVHVASRQLISVQSAIWRHTGRRLSTNEIRKRSFVVPVDEVHVTLAIQSALNVYATVQAQIAALEQAVLAHAKLKPDFEVLRTMPGVDKILGLTVMMETGTIERCERRRLRLVCALREERANFQRQEERRRQREERQQISVLGVFRSRTLRGALQHTRQTFL